MKSLLQARVLLILFAFIGVCVNVEVRQQQQQQQVIQPMVLVHGGAGDISDDAIPLKLDGVKLAARVGYEALLRSSNALDAVQEAVSSMELNPEFNAGYGSVLTWDGRVEMDAALMDGRDLNAGCVSVARDIYHPIQLARSIMENTPHKYLAGDGAMIFAAQQGFEILPEGALVTANAAIELANYKDNLSLNHSSRTAEVPHQQSAPLSYDAIDSAQPPPLYGSPGTVGAVAIDAYGNVAAATSTGGIMGKMPGRIGDSPILGGGTYADNAVGAVSATGQGETIMRYNVASRVLALIEHQGLSAQAATMKVLHDMTSRFKQTAGAISIDANGTAGVYFTSRRMSWAYQRGGDLHFGVEAGEDVVESVEKPPYALF